MPVPQPGTATAAVSTGTKEVVRFGIECQSVRVARRLVNPYVGDGLEIRACPGRRDALRCGTYAERNCERRARISVDYFVRKVRRAPA